MRIKYPKAIQESEEELTRLEQRLRGQKPADRVRMLRLLKSATVKSLKDCAPMVGYSVSQLTRLLGMLPGRRPGRGAQAAQASRQGLAAHCRGVGRLVARDASGTHRDHAVRRAITSSARGGFVTRTASRSGGCSRNTGSSGRPGGDDIKKPRQNNRLLLKKLRSLDQATGAQAHSGLR
jgi:hypothetical protein